MSNDSLNPMNSDEKREVTAKESEFSQVLDTCIQAVILDTIRNILPGLVKSMADSRQGGQKEVGSGEAAEKSTG